MPVALELGVPDISPTLPNSRRPTKIVRDAAKAAAEDASPRIVKMNFLADRIGGVDLGD
jgi:hypothetical protein